LKKIKQAGCRLAVAIVTFLLLVAFCTPTPVEAAKSAKAGLQNDLLSPQMIFRSVESKLTKGGYYSTSGRKFSVKVYDYGGKTLLGVVSMKTKIYYSGTTANNRCASYVECKIEVNPNIFAKNKSGSMKQVGLPNNVVVDGRFNSG